MNCQTERKTVMNNSVSNQESLRVTNTILQQLGGNRFLAMTGSKNLIRSEINDTCDNIWLRMDLTRNKSNVNRLKITLNDDDAYTMYFYRQSMNRKTFEFKITNEKTFERVYASDLRKIFTATTGLYTSL